MDIAPKTETTPKYALRRAVAVGAIAAASFGIYEAAKPSSEETKHAQYTTQVETLELGQGDNVVDAAINGAREIQPELSVEDQAHITQLAKVADHENRVVQPGYEVTVRYGEYDGKPDTKGNYGTDFEVEVTPDVIK